MLSTYDFTSDKINGLPIFIVYFDEYSTTTRKRASENISSIKFVELATLIILGKTFSGFLMQSVHEFQSLCTLKKKIGVLSNPEKDSEDDKKRPKSQKPIKNLQKL